MGVTTAKKMKRISHFMLNNGKEVDYDRAIQLKQQKYSDSEIEAIIAQENLDNQRISRPTPSETGGEEKARAIAESTQLSLGLEKAKYILEHQDLFTKTEVKKAKQVITSL